MQGFANDEVMMLVTNRLQQIRVEFATFLNAANAAARPSYQPERSLGPHPLPTH